MTVISATAQRKNVPPTEMPMMTSVAGFCAVGGAELVEETKEGRKAEDEDEDEEGKEVENADDDAISAVLVVS